MIESPESRQVVRLQSVSQTIGIVSAGLGCLVLSGWTVGSVHLTSIMPGMVAMNPLTAIGFILAGVSLFMIHPRRSAGSQRTGLVLGFAVTLIGLGKLCALFGVDFRPDQILFHDQLDGVVGNFSNRMAPNTALCFLISGLALALLSRKSERTSRYGQALALVTSFISLVALTGYAYDAKYLYGFALYIPMALHTAITFLLLSIGILFCESKRALMGVLFAEASGAAMARRLMPVIVLLSLFLGLLRVEGQRRGLYESEFGAALLTVSSIAIFIALIWWNAESINHLDEKSRRNEHFLESVIENIPHMVFVKAAKDLRFVSLNRAGEELLGRNREDLIGKNDYDLFSKEQADVLMEKDRLALRDGKQVKTEEEVVPTEIKGTRILHTKKIPLLDSAGRPQFLLAISEDITEQRNNVEEIRRLNEELKSSIVEVQSVNRELESFSYSVSHDLRAPLRSMAGFSNILLEEHSQSLDDQSKEYLKRITQAAQRMGKLIDGLLDLSRLTRREIRRDQVNLSEIAEGILSELKASEPHRQVSQVVEKDLVTHADPQLLQVVLNNLIRNAWKFSAKQASAKIEFGATMNSDKRVFYVRDNGAGFEMSYSDKLFGAFQRLHSESEFEGTGIGLATVQRIIHRHGGRIWADGRLNHGATFYFTV